jgi:hypothetical protein
MSETNTQRKTMSAYQQLSGIINALKSEEISLNEALNKIQLKEQRPSRPYCKVTGSGALALYGISKQPMVMYADQWFKFLKVAKSDYIDNYIKYNESRLKFKKKMVKKNDNNDAVEEQFEQIEQVEQLENSETIQES